jgi:hypothetical protein
LKRWAILGLSLRDVSLRDEAVVRTDGVASPHTDRTLDFIQSLKAKHGIDHDCHASYRFVEKGHKKKDPGLVEWPRQGRALFAEKAAAARRGVARRASVPVLRTLYISYLFG